MSCTNTSSIEQLPGNLHIKMMDNNDFVFAVDWNIDIAGYAWEAYIIPESGEAEIEVGTEVTSASSGKMNVIISASSIDAISPSINNWYLNWITPDPENYVRTVLNGKLVLYSTSR